jgi:hypothetical protein
MTLITEGLTLAVDSAIQQFITANGKRQAPFDTNGTVGKDSEGYSVLKAATFRDGTFRRARARRSTSTNRSWRSPRGWASCRTSAPAPCLPTSGGDILMVNARGKLLVSEARPASFVVAVLPPLFCQSACERSLVAQAKSVMKNGIWRVEGDRIDAPPIPTSTPSPVKGPSARHTAPPSVSATTSAGQPWGGCPTIPHGESTPIFRRADSWRRRQRAKGSDQRPTWGDGQDRRLGERCAQGAAQGDFAQHNAKSRDEK